MSDDRRPLAEVVDPRLIDACERHVRDGERLVREVRLRTYLRAPKLHLEPADWNTGYLKVHERDDLPYELQSDLHQLMPQALLRDLHRLVRSEGWVEREEIPGSARDRAGLDGLTEARQARKREPLPRVEAASGAVREYQRWRRQLVSEKWKPVLADDEPRRSVAI
jgi:hypothetical protein